MPDQELILQKIRHPDAVHSSYLLLSSRIADTFLKDSYQLPNKEEGRSMIPKSAASASKAPNQKQIKQRGNEKTDGRNYNKHVLKIHRLPERRLSEPYNKHLVP